MGQLVFDPVAISALATQKGGGHVTKAVAGYFLLGVTQTMQSVQNGDATR
jgi:hypothetical protein